MIQTVGIVEFVISYPAKSVYHADGGKDKIGGQGNEKPLFLLHISIQDQVKPIGIEFE